MSLEVHSEYFRKSSQIARPDEARIERVLYIVEEAYARVKVEIPNDFDTYEGFRRAVQRLDLSSTPGYPYCTQNVTIRDFLEHDGFWFSEFKLKKLWFDVCQLLDGVGWDELYFNIFIKEEPHKLAKLEENRFRIIVGSPLHFQVLCHMLFDFMNDKQIQESYNIPSQQGIMLNGGAWRTYRNQWVGLGLNVGLDKRAWDWTVPGWKLEMVLEMRRRLVFGSKFERWSFLAGKTYSALYDKPLLILSDGSVVRQCYRGVMKSGCVNTIADNSMMQVFDHIFVCEDMGVDYAPLPRCVGDDTLQKMEQVTEPWRYADYGAVVKSASEGLEFVGQEFLEVGPQPLYLEKHLYKVPFCQGLILTQYLDAMLRMYAYSPHYWLWETMAYKLGVGKDMRSRQWYLAWYEYDLD